MPVLVAPADTPLGVSLVRSLADRGGEVRAYATGAGDVGALRAAGAFVAVGDLDDEGRLDAAMTDAHTVIGLHLDPLAPDADQLDHDVQVLLVAAGKAQVRRVVLRSVPGAADDADPIRRVAARAEAALADLAMPTMAVRTSLVDTTAMRDALASRPPGEVEVAPLHPDDVVDALVALDDARTTLDAGHATFRLQGPVRSLASYVEHAGSSMVGRVWTPPERVPLLGPSLDGPWVEETGPLVADLLEFAGLVPRSLGA